ncbi:hypothetical protein [Sphingomonas sp. NPDC079357]|uniref:hypothetical protein n=1 Tax=Sphingomonas sp. NPDC079357 TaxID=3364518 RepID=UPI0038515DFB
MRRRRAQRSPVEWMVRVALAMIAAVAGIVSITSSFGYVIRGKDPARAHTLARSDGRITGQYALTLASTTNPDVPGLRRAGRLAATALKQDPTAVAAASALGIEAQLRGNMRGARRAFNYAMVLSRRDLQSQLWAIEDSVSRGDVAGALRHYDIALRTSRYAPDLLFPVLAAAIADPQIRSAVVRTLAAKPAWNGFFVDYVAGHGPDPQSIADLFIALARASVVVSPNAQRAAVDGLVEAGKFDQAWSYYRMIRPGAKRNESHDPTFVAALDSRSVFDWRPRNDVGINSSIQPNGKQGVFDFAVASGAGGPVLEQSLLLPAGRYRLKGISQDLTAAEGSRPYWTLSCQATKAEFGRFDLTPSEGAKDFEGYFTVPQNCPLQLLQLVTRPSDAIGGVSGRIVQVRLVSAQQHGGEK